MGMKRGTCERYKSVSTPRGSELRCASYATGRKGKAKCHPKLKGGGRSPGLIHPDSCRRKRKHK